MNKNLLPLPIAVILISLNSLWSAYNSSFPLRKILWGYVAILPIISIFLAYLLADIVYSQGKKELEKRELTEPTTRTLFCLYSVFAIPEFIFSFLNRLMISNLYNYIYNYPSSWFIIFIFIIFTTFTIYLGLRWYFFSIKTLFELSWSNALKLGFKASLIYFLYYSLIFVVVYFFMVTLGLIDLPLPDYYKIFFRY